MPDFVNNTAPGTVSTGMKQQTPTASAQENPSSQTTIPVAPMASPESMAKTEATQSTQPQVTAQPLLKRLWQAINNRKIIQPYQPFLDQATAAVKKHAGIYHKDLRDNLLPEKFKYDVNLGSHNINNFIHAIHNRVADNIINSFVTKYKLEGKIAPQTLNQVKDIIKKVNKTVADKYGPGGASRQQLYDRYNFLINSIPDNKVGTKLLRFAQKRILQGLEGTPKNLAPHMKNYEYKIQGHGDFKKHLEDIRFAAENYANKYRNKFSGEDTNKFLVNNLSIIKSQLQKANAFKTPGKINTIHNFLLQKAAKEENPQLKEKYALQAKLVNLLHLMRKTHSV